MVSPSTDCIMALRSFGFVTLRIMFVLHCDIMFLSTFAGR